MSFYLRRAFVDNKSFYVFNDLRLEYKDDAAQIDHLVVHQYGMIIVESKSVTSRIKINEQQEWTRWFNNTPQGIASPILQVDRQRDFLKKYLERHAEVLLGKILGMQSHFRGMPIDILVAISDSGIIERPKKIALEEVCKADQVCDRVRSLYSKRQKDNSVFNLNLNSVVYSFNKNEVNRIIQFLLKEHKPLACKNIETEIVSKPGSVPSPLEKKVVVQVIKAETPSKLMTSTPNKVMTAQSASKCLCRQCHKTNLSVASGRYGYYFKCLDCKGNTPINIVCQTCDFKEKIRKSSDRFYAECETCKTSNLFYTNPTS